VDYTGVIVIPDEVASTAMDTDRGSMAVVIPAHVDDPDSPAIAFRQEAPIPEGIVVWSDANGAFVLVDEEPIEGWNPPSPMGTPLPPRVRWVPVPQQPLPQVSSGQSPQVLKR
jgi:hypothetical protein